LFHVANSSSTNFVLSGGSLLTIQLYYIVKYPNLLWSPYYVRFG